MHPRVPRRVTCLALPLLVACAASAKHVEPVLATLRLGQDPEILVGVIDRDAEPASSPLFKWRIAGGGERPWSRLEALEPESEGWPVELRNAPWRMQTAGFVPGQLINHRLLPMTGELGLVGGRLDALEAVTSMRVASIDDWTIAMVEQDAKGRLLLRRITAEGPSQELQIQVQDLWQTGWPESARLAGFDASSDRVAAFGTIGPTTVVAATDPASPVPELSLPSAGLVAGALLADGPAVASLAGGSLRLYGLRTSGWELQGETAWPEAAKAGAIVLTAGAKPGSSVIAAALTNDGGWPSGAVVVTHDSRGFGATIHPERQAAHPRPHAPPAANDVPAEAALPSRLILAAAALTSLTALIVLATHLRKLRKADASR